MVENELNVNEGRSVLDPSCWCRNITRTGVWVGAMGTFIRTTGGYGQYPIENTEARAL